MLKLVKSFGETKAECLDEELRKLFFSSYDQIAEGIYSVISDPEQRASWDANIKSKDDIIIENKSFWRRLCEVENLNLLLQKFITHQNHDCESSKTWYRAIESFNNLGALTFEDDVDTQKTLGEFFEKFKRVVKPKKIACDEIHLFLEQLSELESYLKSTVTEIDYYNRNKDLHFFKNTMTF